MTDRDLVNFLGRLNRLEEDVRNVRWDLRWSIRIGLVIWVIWFATRWL